MIATLPARSPLESATDLAECLGRMITFVPFQRQLFSAGFATLLLSVAASCLPRKRLRKTFEVVHLVLHLAELR